MIWGSNLTLHHGSSHTYMPSMGLMTGAVTKQRRSYLGALLDQAFLHSCLHTHQALYMKGVCQRLSAALCFCNKLRRVAVLGLRLADLHCYTHYLDPNTFSTKKQGSP